MIRLDQFEAEGRLRIRSTVCRSNSVVTIRRPSDFLARPAVSAHLCCPSPRAERSLAEAGSRPISRVEALARRASRVVEIRDGLIVE
jgi:hypothetical protein